MIQKNEELEVEIIDQGYEGEGIAKVDSFVIFVPETIQGETVRIKILKVKQNIAFAKLLEVLKSSPYRIVPDCDTYAKCGGCNLRHVEYQASLEMKKQAVKNTLQKALKGEVEITEIIGMENPCYYRNKLQYPVGVNENGEISMGVFAKRSHRIIQAEDCKIQNQDCQKVAQDVFAFLKAHHITGYNETTNEGLVRHIIVRIGAKTDEIMLILVLNSWNLPYEEELVKTITNQNLKVKTIIKNLNHQNHTLQHQHE